MAMEGIRSYLQLASGLAEMSRAKAMEAASALLTGSLSGAGAAGSLTTQVQELAEELLAAAAANRRSLVSLIRTEVENAVGRAAVLPVDELDRARAAVAKLSADVEELRQQVMASPAVRSIPEPGRSALTAMSDAMSDAVAGATSSALGQRTPARAQVTEPAASRPPTTDLADLADLADVVSESVTTPTPAPTKRAPRKRTSATKSAASKSAASKSTASKSTASKATASKATASKATATTAAPPRKSAAKTSTAKASTAKTSAAETSAAKASTPTKKAGATTRLTKKTAKKTTKTTAAPAKKTATKAATTSAAKATSSTAPPSKRARASRSGATG